jgi:D-3-phosphoglycerate dehydrogenase
VVSSAVNVPAVAAEDMEVLGPFLPLSRDLGRLAMALAEGSSVDRVEVELLGRIADRETRPLAVEVLLGVLSGHTEEEVNAVNAPSIAEERGIELTETRSTQARDFSDLVRVSVVSGEQRVRVVGTTLGSHHRPHLLEAWGQRFNLQLEPHITLFRYSDVPGMIGRVGTCFGENGINISSAAVGHTPEDGEEGLAVMVVTTDAAVPQAVVDQIVGLDGFVAGRVVALG